MYQRTLNEIILNHQHNIKKNIDALYYVHKMLIWEK